MRYPTVPAFEGTPPLVHRCSSGLVRASGLFMVELDPAHDGYTVEQSARLLDLLPERLSRTASVSGVTLAEAAPFADMAGIPNARFSAPQPKGDVKASVVLLTAAIEFTRPQMSSDVRFLQVAERNLEPVRHML